MSAAAWSEVMEKALAGCPHSNVVPLLPVHLDGWRTTIEGACLDCYDGTESDRFVMFEAYGYGEAARDEPYPDTEQVLLDLDAWWAQLGHGTPAASRDAHGP